MVRIDRNTPRAILPRVFGWSPLMILPDMVASIDCELSKMTITFGFVGCARYSGTVAKVIGVSAKADTGAASKIGKQRRT